MKKIIFLIFLTSCTLPSQDYKDKIETLNFSDNLSFGEFSNLLDKYSEISSYPNIDN